MKHTNFISTDIPEQVRAIAANPKIKPTELYRSESNGHKFKAGEVRKLVGLVDFPEHNGKKVRISSIRKDGANGRAYYIEEDIELNWVYEYRLE